MDRELITVKKLMDEYFKTVQTIGAADHGQDEIMLSDRGSKIVGLQVYKNNVTTIKEQREDDSLQLIRCTLIIFERSSVLSPYSLRTLNYKN